MTKRVIRATPATKVLAKVYQLYMVENQWALILISQSQGTVEATVNANHTIKREAQTVFLKIYFLPSSTGSGALSISRDMARIFLPNKVHKPIDKTVQIVKKVGFRKPF